MSATGKNTSNVPKVLQLRSVEWTSRIRAIDEADEIGRMVAVHLTNGNYSGAREILQAKVAELSVGASPLTLSDFLAYAMGRLPPEIPFDLYLVTALEKSKILTIGQLLNTELSHLRKIPNLGGRRLQTILDAARFWAQEIEQ